MPAKTVVRGRTPAKASHIGSPRREAKAAAKPSKKASRSAAAGLARDGHTRRRDSGIHAKKEPAPRGPDRPKVAVTTPNVPGYTTQVDAEKYNAMKDILLNVLPRKPAGATQGEMFERVREAAPNSLFPGGTARWWAKCVQLDLESKGVIVREPTTPMRWHLR